MRVVIHSNITYIYLIYPLKNGLFLRDFFKMNKPLMRC